MKDSSLHPAQRGRHNLVYPGGYEPVRPIAIAQGMEDRRGTGLHPLDPQDVLPGAALGFRQALQRFFLLVGSGGWLQRASPVRTRLVLANVDHCHVSRRLAALLACSCTFPRHAFFLLAGDRGGSCW
jgi:hypothetical protein